MTENLEKKTFSERMNSSRERVPALPLEDERATEIMEDEESAREVARPDPEPHGRRRMSLTSLFNVVAQKSKVNEVKKKKTQKHETDRSKTWTSAGGGGSRHSPTSAARRDEVRRTEEERMRTETSNHSAISSSSGNEDEEETLLIRFLQATFGQDHDTARSTARSFAEESYIVDGATPPSTRNLKNSNQIRPTSDRIDQLRRKRLAKREELGRAFSDAASASASASSSSRPPSNDGDRTNLKNDHTTTRRSDMKRQDHGNPTSSAVRPGAFHAEGRAFGAMPRWAFSQNHAGTTTSRVAVDTRRSSRRSGGDLKPQERQRLTASRHTTTQRRRHSANNSRSIESASITRHHRNHQNNVEDSDDDPEEPDADEENGNNVANSGDGPEEPDADEENGLLGPGDTVPTLPTTLSAQEGNQEGDVVEATAVDNVVDAMAVYHTEEDPYVSPIQGTPIASAYNPKMMDMPSCRRKTVLPALFILGTIVISLIIAGVTGHLSKDIMPALLQTPSPTHSPTSSPTVNSDELQAILEAFSSVEDLEQVGSPQHKAMIWLANEDRVGISFSDTLFRQRYALVVLYYATQVDGNTWSKLENYISPTENECAWGPSIKCGKGIFQSRLTGLDMGRHGLTGRIPTEIGLLTDIEILQMAENSLSGFIPNEIGNLLKLSYLDLQTNALSGSIPDEVGYMEKLTEFNFCSNKLTGSIPNSLFNLSGLKTLEVCNNQMSGTIAPGFENMKFLTKLNVRNNTMNGTMPVSALGDLVYVWLDDNAFSGSVPFTSGGFTRLEEFTCSNNRLRGKFPTNLTILSGENIPFIRLKKLDFSHNHLTGTIPDETGYLPSLEHLDFSGNNISGTIFSSVAKVYALRYLSLSNNHLTGPLPLFPPQIEHIELGDNDLTGGLSSALLKDLQQLEYFSIKNTMVGGSIPTELGNLHRLKFLDLSYSNITGSIPSEFGELIKLDIMYLNANKINGTLPQEIGENLKKCDEMNFDNNLISGMIPSNFGKLQSIKFMSAKNNMLTGTIPVTLGRLDNLNELRLNGNNLEGSVPEGLCTLNLKLRVDDLVQCSCCSTSNSTLSSLNEHNFLWEDEP
eukprot:CAMPEP_0198281950 /NCGR_PEP_ID=MMETSP1449-20131203/1822_1 /TAXON_ID=420275 /ORGANISM="Attheya septentrionalis, Strain CCMP2084" /LENGTH=1086 /DNA_ID=CAMNT_0043977979 /DNA_START=196 /DNA_END=3456 /DNA_ORIENTATION=-